MLTTNDYYGNEIVQFVMFYSIGAFFQKYKNTIFINNKINYITLICSFIIIFLSIILFDVLGNNYYIFASNSRYLYNRTSIFSILIATSLLNIFINRKEKYCKNINNISSCVFGVYLISDNVYVRKFLWLDLFNNSNYIYFNYLVIHMLVSVCIVFIVCILIEYIRQKTLEKLFNKYLYKKIDNIQKILEDKLWKKIQ